MAPFRYTKKVQASRTSLDKAASSHKCKSYDFPVTGFSTSYTTWDQQYVSLGSNWVKFITTMLRVSKIVVWAKGSEGRRDTNKQIKLCIEGVFVKMSLEELALETGGIL